MRDVKISHRLTGAVLVACAAYALHGSLSDFIQALGSFLDHPVWGPLHATADTIFILFNLILLNVTIRYCIHPPTKDGDD